MAHILSRLNPVPSFPSYTGPYSVGTQDVEIPVAELNSTVQSPDPKISTISFRIFYPCEPSAKSHKHIYWIPEPQRGYVTAYSRFLGASPKLAAFIS